MRARELCMLISLAALWGASFLFMRIAAPQFGPIALIALRVSIAALFLSGILARSGGFRGLRGTAGPMFVLGAINSAIPFTLFAFATLSLSAGFSAVLNATAPLFGALVAFLWLGERLSRTRIFGLFLGLVGVVVLVWGKLSLRGDRLAVAAGLLAALGYGFATHYVKRRCHKLSPLQISTGSQIAASLLLLPLAIWRWPTAPVDGLGLACACALGIGCTGIAYLLYFQLIARIGPTRSITVTYLIPAFAMLWGAVFLEETLTWNVLIGAIVILVGTTIVARAPKLTKLAPAKPVAEEAGPA